MTTTWTRESCVPEPVEGPCASCGQSKPGWFMEGKEKNIESFNCVECVVASVSEHGPI